MFKKLMHSLDQQYDLNVHIDMLVNRMEATCTFKSGTYNEADPTAWKSGTCYIGFDYDPADEWADVKDCPPGVYELTFKDVTWGIQITLRRYLVPNMTEIIPDEVIFEWGLPSIPFDNVYMDHDDMKAGSADFPEELLAFIKAALQSGNWHRDRKAWERAATPEPDYKLASSDIEV